jgi:hypothetical protein
MTITEPVTTAEPVAYKITDGEDDAFESLVVRSKEGTKWAVRCDLHIGFRALLDRGTGDTGGDACSTEKKGEGGMMTHERDKPVLRYRRS